MRDIALQLIHAALEAVNPFTAVQEYLKRDGNTLICGYQTYDLSHYQRVRVIGFGKGSAPMARAIHTLLSDKLTAGLIIVKYKHTLSPNINIDPLKIVEAGHPLPDENSVCYTAALCAFLEDSSPRDLVICLISGGGSALLTKPAAGLSLVDLQALTEQLLAVGATIQEMNTIRKHTSAVKGGQLARLIHPATLLNLIISDVAGDDPTVIASGPTTPDSSTFAQAIAILKKYKLTASLPQVIVNYLQAGLAGDYPETPKPNSPVFKRVQNVIIANNHQALTATIQRGHNLGVTMFWWPQFIEGEAREVAQTIASIATRLTQTTIFSKPVGFVVGGETTVTLHGKGRGGRNQELALAIAGYIRQQPNLLVTCFATDGNDGPTPAAGAFVDGQTIIKSQGLGLDLLQYLRDNNSYNFFQSLGDLVITGPTNTNVNDLVIIISW